MSNYRDLNRKRTALCASVTKLLQQIQDETCKTDVKSDCLLELLAILSQKEKSLQELELEIEREIPLEELDVDIVKTMESK